MTLLDRQLLFVTGKGGVGKTTDRRRARRARRPARASARSCARWTPRARSPLRSTSRRSRSSPPRSHPDLYAMAMNTEDSLREYLRLFVRIPLVGRIGPLARTFDFVADAAPGVKEILAVGKLCYEVRERHYDLVVVDAEASGHIVAQIGAPTGDPRARAGRPRSASRPNWMLDILDDPARTGWSSSPRPRRCRSPRRSSWCDRVARRDRRRRRRGRRQPGAARRCSTEREQAGVRATRATRRRRCLVDGRAGAASAPCSTPRRSTEARRGVGAGHLDRLRCSADCRPTVPAADRARAVHPGDRSACRRRWWPRRSRTSSTSDGLMARVATAAPRRPRRAARVEGDDASSAAAAASARPRWRPRSARIAATELGGRVLVLTVDPARRLADGARARRSSATTRRRGADPTALRRSPASAAAHGELWVAMLDTKAGWDELIRRHAPDARRARSGARQPAVPEHHRPLRAQPRLHRDGAAARAARVGPVRPGHHRHAAVAQRARPARRARAG